MESSKALLAAFALALVFELGLVGANFKDDCDITWEPQNAHIDDDGNSLTLSLVSNSSGSMLRTKKQFIYGSVSTLIQLVPENSAGTVTTYYTSSLGDKHDEIDFEFLGNETGQPYTFHTNVFAGGFGQKEMQFRPWFDPTTGFHNYTIFWNPCMVVWFVDDIPIRVFRNYESQGIPFPTSQPMYGFSSIWAAEDWATQGGRVKADWSKAPFVAHYRDINLQICEYNSNEGYAPQCAYASTDYCRLTDTQLGQMQWVQSNNVIYNYCVDYKRYNGMMPPECSLTQY